LAFSQKKQTFSIESMPTSLPYFISSREKL